MNKNRILFTFFTIVVFSIKGNSQECNCTESFDWMVSTFEKNDAGFQYVIDKKGINDYNKHTLLFREKSKDAITLVDCQTIMFDWLHYFRPDHVNVWFNQAQRNMPNETEKKSDNEIRLQYKNEKTKNLTEKSLISILEKKDHKNPIEGVWSTIDNKYKIGIIADEKFDRKFTAFMIKADSIYWIPKQVKAELTLNDDNQTFLTSYLMRDHSKVTTQTQFINDSNTILSMYYNFWVRKYPVTTLTKKDQFYLSVSKSPIPFVEKLSDKTIYLRIPSFEINKKKDIDSILIKYNDLITSTPNLIIDIRNGTGGADASYEKIIPYLYTNPIRYLGIQLYSTEMNAKAFEMYAKEYDDTIKINYFNKIAARMKVNVGKFIPLWDKPFLVDSSGMVLPLPQKVAIICNQGNGSTDEQFLLIAKQSRKVKVFGRPTRGALDISNLNEIEFPNGKFMFAYGMSKSYRIPNYCIDGIGIQPDYFLDDSISEYNWIDYTMATLEK